MSDKQYYQFDLNFRGDYIRGYSDTEIERRDYVKIENPQINIGNDSNKYKIDPSVNTIKLAKSQIVCYYVIKCYYALCFLSKL